MTKTYEIYSGDELIDTIWCENESEANSLAEEIYPSYLIFIQEKLTIG